MDARICDSVSVSAASDDVASVVTAVVLLSDVFVPDCEHAVIETHSIVAVANDIAFISFVFLIIVTSVLLFDHLIFVFSAYFGGVKVM